MKNRKWILVSVLAVVGCYLAILGVCRIDAELECWELSYSSPLTTVNKSDYIAKARFLGARRVATVQVNCDRESYTTDIVESVYATTLRAKGDFDTVAIWTQGFGMNQIVGETTLVYGRQIEVSDSLYLIIRDSLTSPWDSCKARALSQSTEAHEEFDKCAGRTPILGMFDGGRAFSTLRNYGGLCYYDKRGKARSVTTQEYWEEINELMSAKE